MLLFLNILVALVAFIKAQSSKPLELDTEKKGSLGPQSVAYFYLKIPDNVTANTYYLLVKVMENELLDSSMNILSDPNLYVSTTNKNPNNEKNSEWFSQRFGGEIISIDSKHVQPNSVFYIGVTCEKQCNFILSAKLYKEYEISANKVYGLNLESQESVRIKFKTPKQYNEFSVSCIGMNLNPFRMYLARSNPSSSNTLPSYPIYTNGYRFTVVKGTKDYATDAEYELLIQSIGQKNSLRIWIKFDKKEMELREYQSYFDTIKKFGSLCYRFYVGEKVNDDVITSVSLFSGSGVIQITGWESGEKMTYDDIPYNDYTYEVTSDTVIKLTKEEIEKLPGNRGDNSIHLCFFAEEASSLILKMYNLNSTERVQRLNFLLPGKPTGDYLPVGQATRYQLIHYDNKKNVTVTLENKQSSAKLFLIFCSEENCTVNQQKIEDELKKGNLLTPTRTFNGYEIKMNTRNNMCLDPVYVKAITSCQVFAVVSCESESECVYKVGFSHEDIAQFMQPRTPYYRIIPDNFKDEYVLEIVDSSVENIAVVLNTHTGQTELTIFQYTDSKNTTQVLSKKFNNEFLPNVATISKKDLNRENLIGKFYVNVKSHAFSSYTLYYYPFSSNSTSPEHLIIAMKLQKGHIIQDYFDENQKIKVYSYDNFVTDGEQEKNLVVALTKMNGHCSLYVFKDLDDFTYNETSRFNKVGGYVFRSDYGDQIVMNVSDSKYIRDSELYIMVIRNEIAPDYQKEGSSYSSFHIGITDNTVPFLLSDGMEQKTLLQRDYPSQKYYYVHMNKTDPLMFSVNIFYGKITVKLQINKKDYFTTTGSKNVFVRVPAVDLVKYCTGADECGIDIEVSKESPYNTQFLIVCKSHPETPEKLLPGITRTQKILSGENYYYDIEAIPDERIGIRISSRFNEGRGVMYASLTKYNDTNYPDEKDHDYISSQFSSNGQVINIPYKDVKDKSPVHVYLTVNGVSPAPDTNQIEYSLSYSTQSLSILPNVNYELYISSGEMQFYTFHHSKSKSLYISMSNKKGDADIYLNYGQGYPTTEKYNWKSTGAYTETLDLNSDDSFFVSKGLSDISGDYSMMVYGYSNTSFSLFISSDDVKLVGFNDEYGASCTCKSEGDVCFFRYESINDFGIKKVVDKEIIFTVDYTYGDGVMFGKLYSDGSNENIMKSLPSPNNHDFSTTNNFINVKLKASEPMYTIDSKIVFGVFCKAKSMFDITAVKLQKKREDGKTSYITFDKDYVFSLAPYESIVISFFAYKTNDVGYEVKAYSGSGTVTMYTNTSYYDYQKKETNYRYKNIVDFIIKETEPLSFFGNISSKDSYSQYVYMKVTSTSNKDTMFYVKTSYITNLTRIPMGKEVVYPISNNGFRGYFDFLPDFDEIMLTVTSETDRIINVYTKMNRFNKDSLVNNGEFVYDMPTFSNNDMKGKSSTLLSSVSFKIKGPPAQIFENFKTVRIVFLVAFDKQDYYNPNDKIYVLVSPNVNHYQTIRAEQGAYYYTSITNLNKDKVLFNMLKSKPNDDLMVIEISACQGDFDYSVTDDISLHSESGIVPMKARATSSNGRKIIIVPNLSEKENYYLSVWGTVEGDFGCVDSDDNCIKDVDFLMFYFTTEAKDYQQTTSSSVFEYEPTSSGFKILLPKLISKDAFGNQYNLEMLDYKIIFSEKPADFKYMESICYLNRLYDEMLEKNLFSGIKYKYDNTENVIDVSGMKKGKYFINVLITNPATGEVLTFRPVQIQNGSSGINTFFFIIICIVLVIAIGFAVAYYLKFKRTDLLLKYEVNDIRNAGSIPKSEVELRRIDDERKKEKYTTLTEDTQNI